MERVPFMVLKVEEGITGSGRKKQTHPPRPLHGFRFPRLPWHFVLTSLLHLLPATTFYPCLECDVMSG